MILSCHLISFVKFGHTFGKVTLLKMCINYFFTDKKDILTTFPPDIWGKLGNWRVSVDNCAFNIVHLRNIEFSET